MTEREGTCKVCGEKVASYTQYCPKHGPSTEGKGETHFYKNEPGYYGSGGY